MKMETNWKIFLLVPVSKFSSFGFRLLQSDSLFNFYILCLCCAHAFNGLANVWEVRVLIHEVNVIPFWCVWWDCKQCPFENALSAIFHHGFSTAELRVVLFLLLMECEKAKRSVNTKKCNLRRQSKISQLIRTEFSARRPWNESNSRCHHQLVEKIVNSVHFTCVAHLLDVAMI